MVAWVGADLTREAGENRHLARLHARQAHHLEELRNTLRTVATRSADRDGRGNGGTEHEEENGNGDAKGALELEHFLPLSYTWQIEFSNEPAYFRLVPRVY